MAKKKTKSHSVKFMTTSKLYFSIKLNKSNVVNAIKIFRQTAVQTLDQKKKIYFCTVKHFQMKLFN